MIDTVLIDLDGTLVDSGDGIRKSARTALKHYGITDQTDEELNRFIGPPLVAAFEELYGFEHRKAVEAMRIYREYYARQGIFEAEVYPGVPQMLKRLKDAGMTLALATSKPEHYARQVTDHYNLTQYFDLVSGALDDERRSVKKDVIEHIIAVFNLKDRDKIIMMGDKKQDIIGAKACGLKSLGILYGYGVREEHEKAGADHIAETPAEAADIILNI